MKCTSKQLLLDHPHPEYFITSQWKWPPIVYVLYRVVAALYLLVWLALSGVVNNPGTQWFLYFTNWTFLLLNLNAVIMALTTLHHFVRNTTPVMHIDGSSIQEMPWYLKVQWVIYNTATTASLVVTAGYWTLVWAPNNGMDMTEFHVHAYNSIYVIIDMFITATPVRLLHFYHPMLYGLVYVVFNLTYTGAGGMDGDGNNYIYSILDFYSNPGTAIMYSLLTLFIGIPLTWLFVYRLAGIRVFHNKRAGCRCSRQSPTDEFAILFEKGYPGNERVTKEKQDHEKKERTGKVRQGEKEESSVNKATNIQGTQYKNNSHLTTVFVTKTSNGQDYHAFVNGNV